MNPRFQGFGKALILVPVLSYIPLRVVLGYIEETHRSVVLCVSLMVSAFITLVIAAVQDKKAGIDVFARHAWTGGILESQHIFFYLPIRVVGVILLIASVGVLWI
jgi:hypothetical protein